MITITDKNKSARHKSYKQERDDKGMKDGWDPLCLLRVIRFKVVKTSFEKKSLQSSCLVMLCLLSEEYQKVNVDWLIK